MSNDTDDDKSKIYSVDFKGHQETQKQMSMSPEQMFMSMAAQESEIKQMLIERYQKDLKWDRAKKIMDLLASLAFVVLLVVAIAFLVSGPEEGVKDDQKVEGQKSQEERIQDQTGGGQP